MTRDATPNGSALYSFIICRTSVFPPAAGGDRGSIVINMGSVPILRLGAIAAQYLATYIYMMVVDIQLEQRDRGAVSRSETNSRQGLGNRTMSRGGNPRGWYSATVSWRKQKACA